MISRDKLSIWLLVLMLTIQSYQVSSTNTTITKKCIKMWDSIDPTNDFLCPGTVVYQKILNLLNNFNGYI